MDAHTMDLGTILESGMSSLDISPAPGSPANPPPDEVQEIDPSAHDLSVLSDPASDDDDETEFTYTPQSASTFANAFLRGANINSLQMTSNKVDAQVDDGEEEFSYPTTSPLGEPSSYGAVQAPEPTPVVIRPVVQTPSSTQLEAIFAAASAGNLASLRDIFAKAQNEQSIEPFVLANEATSRTGLNSLHAAASRGYLDTVRWLIQDCGAMANVDDKEGETALHKAALNGHLPVVAYLLSLQSGKADVQAQDADGYTALHNACSQGYLDIVRWLCEQGGANEEFMTGDDESPTSGVNIRSKDGWTPLMNASSKGHLPVVLYLLSKQKADPLVRNNWGETAFDVAAAVFEIWICEVLQHAEMERWSTSGSPLPYNTLAIHSTVPLILYENQRLDTRLKTLAVNSGRPRFSTYHLGRRGRKPPFELTLWGAESPNASFNGGSQRVPAWRSSVQLPYLTDTFSLPSPNSADPQAREGAERSHFWMSDWTLDSTHPRVDVTDGWQYARTLEQPDDKWTAEVPSQLERLLSGSGIVSAGLVAGSSSGSSATSRTNGRGTPRDGPSGSNLSWARRRRWVRVMRRRLDQTPLPFLQPDGNFYSITEQGTLVPYIPDELSDFGGDEGGMELGSPAVFSQSHQDYVSRARYLAGSSHGVEPDLASSSSLPAAEIKKTINKLGRAVAELRLGILNDNDPDRRTHAEVLINTYNRELERTRLAAGASGILMMDNTDNEDENDDGDDSDDSFHYPTTPGGSSSMTAPRGRPASIRSHHTDYFSLTRSNSTRADLTPQLAQAAEFRVPTHDAPQKVLTPGRTAPTPHAMHSQWESDDRVSECRSCKRRFTFYFRKHHCRKCGRVYCNNCSSHRALLEPADVVSDPSTVDEVRHAASIQRVCQSCFDEVNISVPTSLRPSRSTSGMESVVVDNRNLSVPRPGQDQEGSQISDLADCPVCGQNLAELGPANAQEYHVRSCLEGGDGPGQTQAGKYIVYKLPAESVLVGVECVICLEEFVKGSLVARLSCLCTFHNPCLSAWLQRGRACPVHARDT